MARNEEMAKLLAAQEAEMKKKVKTSQDALQEALYRLRNSKKEDLSLEEILAEDNKVRSEYGMRELKSYPVMLKEWRGQDKVATWQRLTGAKIIKERGKLPVVIAEFIECEGYDAANDEVGIVKEVEQLAEKLFPTADVVTKAQKDALRTSVVQRRKVELAGEVMPKEEVEEEVIKPVATRGRPKKT